MSEAPDAKLPEGPYLNLVTFRRDGSEVATPLWFVEIDGMLFAYTIPDSAKVRRLRNNPAARVAPCTVNGKITGPWKEGKAREISDPTRLAEFDRAMVRKYPLGVRVANLFAGLRRIRHLRALLEIEVA